MHVIGYFFEETAEEPHCVRITCLHTGVPAFQVVILELYEILAQAVLIDFVLDFVQNIAPEVYLAFRGGILRV